MKAADPPPCPKCRDLERENAQLRRDLEDAAQSATHFYHLWIELCEGKKGTRTECQKQATSPRPS